MQNGTAPASCAFLQHHLLMPDFRPARSALGPLLALVPAFAFAAASPPPPLRPRHADAPTALDEVHVTGTRLARSLAESPINFSVISRETIAASGRARLGELLRELPDFFGNPVVETVAFNESRGVSGFDLRGLGLGSTLILVDGRRPAVNANTFEFTRTYVDLNRFSPAFVERVEVLKSGASAVYGADAVGGVVNLITRQPTNGGEFSVGYGNAFRNDAAELTANLLTSTVRGPVALAVGVDWFQRHAQAHVDRPFSRSANHAPRYVAAYDFYAALAPAALAIYDGRQLTSGQALVRVAPGQVNGRNGVNLPGLAAGAAIDTLPGTRALGLATPSFSSPFTGATGGQFRADAAATFAVPETTRTDPAARNLYDWNRDIWTLPEANRLAADARLTFEGPGFTVFAQASGGRNRSRTEYHPRAFSGVVPRTNAFNPFGIDVAVDWRIPDRQRRRALTEDDYVSGVLGVRSAPRAAVAWETAVAYSRDEYVDTARGVYRLSGVRDALASSDPATALNPFGGVSYRQSAAVLDRIATTSWFGGDSDLLTFDARVGGTLLRLPMGPLRAAAFAEHRRENYSAVSDAASRAGDIMGTGAMGPDIAPGRNVSALALELHAPLLAGGRGASAAPRLALEAAGRIEDFSRSFNSDVKPSVGLVAHPGRDLLVRASFARTFRAPSLAQLYSPQNDTFFNSVPDPRRPSALTGDDNDGPNIARLVRTGGNPKLNPETGRTWQAGTVWSPTALRGASLEATWFRYELEDLISGVSPTYILENELGGLGDLVHRASGSQTFVNRSGAPVAVLTGPAGQTTTVAPGQSATVPGRLERVDVFTVNLSRRRLEGWDFGLRQRGELAGGRWQGAAHATYVHFTGSAYDAAQPMGNSAGAPNSPRWRGQYSFDWTRGAWSPGTTFSYQAHSGHHEAESRYQKPYRLVHLRLTYTAPRDGWLRGTGVTVGLDDVFDEEPPLYLDHPIGFNYASIARPQGRFWRVTLRRAW